MRNFGFVKPDQKDYDGAITIYSPDGRLFQVEYAREAIKKGTLAIGLKFTDGVVLIAEKKTKNNLVETKIAEKLFKIDDFVGCVVAGLVADGRIVVDYARIHAQINKITYNERITVTALTKKICEFLHLHTQFAGIRPFGVSLLVAGVEESSIQLYEIDPSGVSIGYKAGGVGGGRSSVIKIFEDKYKEDMSRSKAILLGLEALEKVADHKFDGSTIEIGVIDWVSGFRELSAEESQEYLDELSKKRE